MKKEINADFYIVKTRPPAVYRGNPFQIEVGIAYGHPGGAGLAVNENGHIDKVVQQKPDAAEALLLHADEPKSECALARTQRSIGRRQDRCDFASDTTTFSSVAAIVGRNLQNRSIRVRKSPKLPTSSPISTSVGL